MGFQINIRIGISIFLILIIVGITSYFYSIQKTRTYPVTTPITQYNLVQRSRQVSIDPTNNDPLTLPAMLPPHANIFFGPYDASTYRFETIAFDLIGSSAINVFIDGVSKHFHWMWVSNDLTEHVSVSPDDNYRIYIKNPCSVPIYMVGSIHFYRTEVYWENVPYTTYTTTYQTTTDTVYPHRSLGAVLFLVGIVTGIGTVVSILQSKRRMKEIDVY